MPPAATWVRITIPPSTDTIRTVQQVASSLSERCGIDKNKRQLIELSVEELIRGILHISFDDGNVTEGELTFEFKIEPPYFLVNVINKGLPFDLSMIPEYKGAPTLEEDAAAEGLAMHLIKKSADNFRLVNNGREGLQVELTWLLPGEHIENLRHEAAPAEDEQLPPEQVEDVRVLDEAFAIQIARLVFRGYGFSYVYEDIYYPDRVRAFFHSGQLKSWGAVTPSGRLVGHLTLMKESTDSGALEWGVAVVDPKWRGMGLMEHMLRAAMDYAADQKEKILYAHAVTTHPYTQKTCSRFGFQSIALLLAYAPGTMKFKGINNELKQRESTFLSVRCTHPLPVQTLYLPHDHAPVLRRLLAALAPPLPEECLLEGDEQADLTGRKTVYTVSAATYINVGRIQIVSVGADYAQVLLHETRRLSREGVDVIYLTVDLADPGAARLVHAAEYSGYFLAGLTPMMLPAYGLTLQLLCGCKVDFAAIQTHGELAEWLKEQVAMEYRRIEAGLPPPSFHRCGTTS
ncbi:Protein N-acetyltransferase, RimJ/RimL family [Desulfonatronum thiosulfatophilum]|uniref:Protein N-acetyltransferase, RimJ/RimL family n=1 Tax=Desulfonatronum thiosulfatophilum TaxID=617002 RepID=A0A1G6BEA9_9BACT|nr:GNAT family N-acetyltransferase [Desulfonatronum thiosulfatophilum]SDB18879.1 Protein N-acetyltransferase, RimJ/RimL family [Desulfonatronum thiosulfatophilum]